MFETLKIIHWPDPRLTKVSKPVTVFDETLRALVARMFELMHEAPGVGLAAPQVGHNLRLFVMNHSGEPADDRVYINPELFDGAGEVEGEEGCLSLPGITTPVLRSESIRIKAVDIEGAPIEDLQSDLIARIWQHEFDHLNGVLLLDRMGPVARLTSRKAMREMKAEWEAQQSPARPTRLPTVRR